MDTILLLIPVLLIVIVVAAYIAHRLSRISKDND